MNKKQKNKGGRPKVITKQVLQKLEEAFEVDCSDSEACIHAGISTSTLYNYQRHNVKFLERKQLLKTTLTFKARQTICNKIESGDVRLAKWYLERKVRDEFGLK